MTVGSELGQARVALGLSLADVASRTRVRASLLSAIEADDFAGCGGAVYARGHIRSFAAAVGLDPAPLISDYDAHHETVPVPVLSDALPSRSMQGIHERSRPNWLPVGIGAAAALSLALLITYFTTSGSPRTPVEAGNKPEVSAAPATSPPAAPVVASPTPSVVAQLAPVVVSLKITKAPGSWVQEVDGQGAFAQTLTPNTTKTFTSQKLVGLRFGNAGAVDVTVNGKHLGLLGADGAVVNKSWGPEGAVKG